MSHATARAAAADVALAREVLEAPRVFYITNLYGSAGSYFIHTLFDSHPDVWTFLYDMRRAPVFVDDFDAHTPEQHVRALLEDNARFFDTASERGFMNTLNQLGDSRDRGIAIDRDAFARLFTAILESVPFTMRNFALAMTIAHNLVRGIRPRTNTFVLYTHDFPRTVLFQRGFGTGRIIGMARHPVNAHVSRGMRRFRDRLDLARADRVDARTALRLPLYRPSEIDSLVAFYRDLPAVEERVAVLSIEELHVDPRGSMERLVADLGIRFVPSLLESTIGGLKWWGSHYTRVQGFSPGLHRDVDPRRAGVNDTAAVTLVTRCLQQHLGYTSPPLSPLGRVRAHLPGRRYLDDVGALVQTVAGRQRSVREQAWTVACGLERAVKYVVGRTVLENLALRRVAALDRTADFSKLVMINPVRPGTVRWLGEDGR
ncbi:MAG: sulfotransferase [Candidatus Rokubacteria bacterium]|nr:sulfotransferase [Candidatus Rokubacteria bacterium]